MVQVIWTQEALRSLQHISDYIDHFDPDAGERIFLKLWRAGEGLAEFPRRGRPAGGGKRELTIVPPYVLRYAVRGEKVVIFNIRHGRQRPSE